MEGVIFDLGSVCFDIDWLKIDKEMKKTFGVTSLIRSSGNVMANKLYDEFQEGKGSLQKVFEELGLETKKSDEAVAFYMELYKKYNKSNEEIFKLIKSLKGKLKLICLTDTNEVHFQAYQEKNSLKDFDKIFTSFELGSIKSNPGTFKKILNELEIKPEELVFIDDNKMNIENARASGINAIKYEDNEQLFKELKNIEFVK